MMQKPALTRGRLGHTLASRHAPGFVAQVAAVAEKLRGYADRIEAAR